MARVSHVRDSSRCGVVMQEMCLRTYLAGLVLSDLVLCVLPAVAALAVGLAGLGNVHLIVALAGARAECLWPGIGLDGHGCRFHGCERGDSRFEKES